MDNHVIYCKIDPTIVWKKFTLGYFRVKFIRGEIFLSFGASIE